jgi:DNA-directed RNA polymerase subunit RPC12/RpoP
MTRQLSLLPPKQRATPVRRMHVIDAGYDGYFRFHCRRCDMENEFHDPDLTVTQAKRGIPCPKCNEATA